MSIYIFVCKTFKNLHVEQFLCVKLFELKYFCGSCQPTKIRTKFSRCRHNTGKQLDQNPGDFLSFWNFPQGGFPVEVIRITAIGEIFIKMVRLRNFRVKKLS